MVINEIQGFVEELAYLKVSEERKKVLQPVVNYIKNRLDTNESVALNFICTHNSRRSQFAQIWAQVAAYYFGFDQVSCYSGGVEVTALNDRVAHCLEGIGLGFNRIEDGTNPIFQFMYNGKIIVGFSKLFDDEENPKTDFAAIMTCSHADENCPFIPGADERIPVRYIDPKVSDDTVQENATYLKTCKEIAEEMFYVFSQL